MVAAGFIHRATPHAVVFTPNEARGHGLPQDKARCDAALVDEVYRTLSLPEQTPWRLALEALF